MHGPSEGVSEETDEANSAVKIVGGNVFVELDQTIQVSKTKDTDQEEMKLQRLLLNGMKCPWMKEDLKKFLMLHTLKMKTQSGLL